MVKISTILPTFNSEKFVGYVIMSLLNYVDEIVVIDMASTDNTYSIINYIGSSKIRFIPLKGLLQRDEEHNLDYSIKYGLKQSTGDVVIRVDDDWVWGDCIKKIKEYCEQGMKEKKRGAFYSTYNLITRSEYFLPIRRHSAVLFRNEGSSLVSFGSYKTDNSLICHFDEIKRSSGRHFVRQKRSRYLETPLALGHWKFLKDNKEEFIKKWMLFTKDSRKVAEHWWVFYHKQVRSTCPKNLLDPLFMFRNDFVGFGGFDIEKVT